MRICFVQPELPVDAVSGGGIHRYTWIMAQSLAGLGHEVFVVQCGHGSGREVARRDGVTVHTVPIDPEHRFFRLFRNRVRSIPEVSRAYSIHEALARIHAEHPIDVIEAPEFLGQGRFGFARLPGVARVTRLHTPTWLARRLNGQPPTFDAWFLDRMERSQLGLSDAVTSPTEALAERVRRHWRLERPIEVIPNCIPPATAWEAQDATPPEGPDPDILYFGRIEPRKGILVLAEALDTVLREQPGAHAVFVGEDVRHGDGTLGDAIRKRLARYGDRVTVRPALPWPALRGVVARARVVVFPSLWENFPMACLEAMTLGRAIVATDQGGLGEMIEDGVSGRLVPPGDAGSLAGAILDVLRTGKDAQLGKGAAARAERYSCTEIVPRMASFYAAVADRKGRGASA